MIETLDHNPEASKYLAAIKKLEGQKKCDPREVASYLTKIIELEPEYAPAYIKRSSYNFQFCEYGMALQDVNKAIELGTQDPEAFFRRAECYEIIGSKEEERMADIKKVLELDPRHAQANAVLGHYFYEIGKKKHAYIHFTEAIDSKTNDPLVFLKRALMNMEDERYEYAIVDLLNSQRCNPHNAILFSLRAECYFKIGAIDKAIQDHKSAAFLEPHNAEHYYQMGLLYYEKGDLDGAIVHFDMLTRMEPDYSLGYYSRGIAYLEKNDTVAAIADLEKAFEMAPNAETCQLLAIAYTEAGNDELSKKYYEQAIAMGAEPEAE